MPDIDSTHFDLGSVVEALSANNTAVCRSGSRPACMQPLPSRDAVIGVTELLRSALFPGYFGVSELTQHSMRFHIGATLDHVQRILGEQVRRGLCFACDHESPSPDCEARAANITRTFLARLPEVQRLVASDVQAAYEGDPALTSPDEAIFCYPGVSAITSYRLAHAMHRLGVPLLPRMITEHAHSTTGIDIHPGASVGEMFFIDHGTGVVIGETCIIGKRVRIYQGVTLGAKSFPLDAQGNPIKGIPRHPIVEDDVVIYSGATILGRITLGQGSIIGGNVWLTRSIPAGSRVTQVQARQEIFEAGGGI
ncbi:MAG: serine acetyltransferase [Pseudomonadota bacterium]